MKRSSFLISQSLVFWLLLPSSLAFSQTDSKNGWRITPKGDLRVLIIFAEIDYGNGSLNSGTSEWPQGDLPTFADEWYDKTWTGSPQKEMTKYFYEMSLGHYRVTGDYINSIITIDLSDFTSPCSGAANALNQSCDSARSHCGQTWYNTELLSHDGIANAVIAEANSLGSLNTSLGLNVQDFDAWNHPSSAGAPRSPTGNDAYDHVMIVLRNWKCQSASTARYANFPQSLYGKDADTWSVFNTTSFDIRKHEYGHLLLGDNGFHASGGHDRGNSSYYLSTQCGWGLMGNAASTIKTVNAWERRRLGWRASGRTMDISCLDGATEVNTDLDASDPNDEGSFKIWDFVTTGDAIRIKLPFIPGSEFQQWLWIENHQGVSDFDNHDYRSCQTPFKEGLYVYVQTDKETVSGSGTFGGYADYIKPLSASGMHDIEIEGEHTYSNCDLANEVNRVQTWKMANPLSGYSDYQQTDYDKNGDGHLIFKDREGLHVQSISGNPTPNWAWRGHSRHAFHNGTEGNNEVGISTNPSTASHTTLVSNDNVVNLPPSSPENNRTIYINGILVEITNYNSGTGEITVNVEFDQVTLDQDTRWCGDDIVLPYMASVYPSLSGAGWSLMLAANKTLDIDRSKMPSRINNPDTIIPTSGPWEYLFNDPTTFRMAPDASMKAYEGSEINVKNGSSFILGSGNELDIENGTLNILSGSKLILNKGSLLDLSGSAGEVYIDPTSTLIIRGGSDIHLDGYDSELIIEGTVIVEDSGSLSFDGLGFITFAGTIENDTTATWELRGEDMDDVLMVLYTSPDWDGGIVNLTMGMIQYAGDDLEIEINDCDDVNVNSVRFTSKVWGYTFEDNKALHLNSSHIECQSSEFLHFYHGILANDHPGTATVDDCVFESNVFPIEIGNLGGLILTNSDLESVGYLPSGPISYYNTGLKVDNTPYVQMDLTDIIGCAYGVRLDTVDGFYMRGGTVDSCDFGIRSTESLVFLRSGATVKNALEFGVHMLGRDPLNSMITLGDSGCANVIQNDVAISGMGTTVNIDAYIHAENSGTPSFVQFNRLDQNPYNYVEMCYHDSFGLFIPDTVHMKGVYYGGSAPSSSEFETYKTPYFYP